jgi:cell division protein FtsB
VFNKIQKFISESIFKNLQDIRTVGLLIFGVIAVLVTWSGVGAVETNYNLQKQISQLQQQNNLSNLQNNDQQLQNEYYNTNEYVELQARELLGKALPGEKLVLVPQNVALANTVSIPQDKTITATSPPLKPTYQSNFEAWVNFFFHRNG